MADVRELAHVLRSRCRFAFSADPYVEIGKLLQQASLPEAWAFHVYVMTTSSSDGKRSLQRSNVVLVTQGAIDVKGPDEYEIGQIFKEPIL